jgi:acyl-CoA synthetase (AMP-forming)/AMP-acid ligase II
MLGYFANPEHTRRSLVKDDQGNTWLRTGDIVRMDSEGFFYVVDRKKDMIIRGGYNVYCVEVESALFEHPDVTEVAVVGTPHPVLGQDVCAVVRLRPGADLDLEGARSYLRDRLADYKLPRRLVVRDEPLPRSATAKVDKKALLASVLAVDEG